MQLVFQRIKLRQLLTGKLFNGKIPDLILSQYDLNILQKQTKSSRLCFLVDLQQNFEVELGLNYKSCDWGLT